MTKHLADFDERPSRTVPRRRKPTEEWTLRDWKDEANELQKLVWAQNAEIKKFGGSHQKLVHDMMMALNIPLENEDHPRVNNLNFKLLRSLVAEEAKEFNDAMVLLEHVIQMNCGIDLIPYWAEVIDAICDIDVVIHNTSNAMGIDTEPFFQEVHRSNMAKAGGPTRSDGKKLKPKGWEPPRIKEMLKEILDGTNPTE